LLLDPNLRKIIADDFNNVVNNSKFQVQVNSWKPRQNPKIKLALIYNNTNSNNIRESFASLVQPVVEIACTPQNHDPLNEHQSKCIKELFKYPIIETIKIGYTYRPNTTIDQNIAYLSGLTDKYRYQQIVCTVADILNGAYEKVSKKNVTKSVNFTKYPLNLVAPTVATAQNFSVNDKIIISNEKAELESQINQKRMECHDTRVGRNEACYNAKKELEGFLRELETNPTLYFSNKEVRAVQAQAKKQARLQEQEEEKHRVNHGAINPFTGEFLAPAGDGYVGTRDGTFYAPAGPNGIINTRTGEFSPLTQ
jgi:hypothetical protein